MIGVGGDAHHVRGGTVKNGNQRDLRNRVEIRPLWSPNLFLVESNKDGVACWVGLITLYGRVAARTAVF